MKKLSIVFIFMMMISCDSSRVYEDYYDMEEAFWHIDSIQSYQFEIQDTTKRYHLKATFRNSSSYPFYNLYFQYSLLDSLDNVIIQELTEVHFFDSKTGEPLGNGLGDLFDHTFPLEENYKFETQGKYSIQLQQFMRMDTLPFILSVGARVELVE